MNHLCYKLIKEIVLQFFGDSSSSPFSSGEVAIVQLFGATCPTTVTAIVTSKHDDGTITIFMPTGPNPTSGNIFIKSVDDSTIREVVVYSSNGKFLKRIKNDIGVEELLINVTEFGKNILFLGISSENGTVFRKVIIIS